MKIIRFIDIVETDFDESGEPTQKVTYPNFTLPTIIEDYKIESISPLFTASGTLFKNVSIIKYGEEIIKVYGNYRDLERLKANKPNNITGFRNGKQTEAYVKK